MLETLAGCNSKEKHNYPEVIKLSECGTLVTPGGPPGTTPCPRKISICARVQFCVEFILRGAQQLLEMCFKLVWIGTYCPGSYIKNIYHYYYNRDPRPCVKFLNKDGSYSVMLLASIRGFLSPRHGASPGLRMGE